LGISGDFKKREMIETLEKAFQGWDRALIEFPHVPLPSPQEGKSIQYAAKDLPVSTILLGHLSLPLGHPDYFAFQILNFILGGGGFNSRLVREVRSNQGLAYAVGSFYRGRVGYGKKTRPMGKTSIGPGRRWSTSSFFLLPPRPRWSGSR
jgi:zinc protease